MRRVEEIEQMTDLDMQTTAVVELLRVVQEAEPKLTELRERIVHARRARGESHAEVATAFRISRGRAQQIAEGRQTGRRSVRPAPDVTDEA